MYGKWDAALGVVERICGVVVKVYVCTHARVRIYSQNDEEENSQDLRFVDVSGVWSVDVEIPEPNDVDSVVNEVDV